MEEQSWRRWRKNQGGRIRRRNHEGQIMEEESRRRYRGGKNVEEKSWGEIQEQKS